MAFSYLFISSRENSQTFSLNLLKHIYKLSLSIKQRLQRLQCRQKGSNKSKKGSRGDANTTQLEQNNRRKTFSNQT